MKKKKDFFEKYLDEIYEITKMLKEEGHSSAECSYCEIMAVILLFINEGIRAIRFTLSIALGVLLGFAVNFILMGG